MLYVFLPFHLATLFPLSAMLHAKKTGISLLRSLLMHFSLCFVLHALSQTLATFEKKKSDSIMAFSSLSEP